MTTKLNLGCGPYPRPGWVNVDAINYNGSGIILMDLNKPWLFEDAIADEVLADNVLEHLHDENHFLKELGRVLKPGATATIIVPHYKAPTAYRITHKTFHSWVKWADWPEPHDKDHGLEIVSCKLITGLGLDWLANLAPIYWEKFFYACGIKIVMEAQSDE